MQLSSERRDLLRLTPHPQQKHWLYRQKQTQTPKYACVISLFHAHKHTHRVLTLTLAAGRRLRMKDWAADPTSLYIATSSAGTLPENTLVCDHTLSSSACHSGDTSLQCYGFQLEPSVHLCHNCVIHDSNRRLKSMNLLRQEYGQEYFYLKKNLSIWCQIMWLLRYDEKPWICTYKAEHSSSVCVCVCLLCFYSMQSVYCCLTDPACWGHMTDMGCCLGKTHGCILDIQDRGHTDFQWSVSSVAGKVAPRKKTDMTL